jgi:hypothetical protein
LGGPIVAAGLASRGQGPLLNVNIAHADKRPFAARHRVRSAHLGPVPVGAPPTAVPDRRQAEQSAQGVIDRFREHELELLGLVLVILRRVLVQGDSGRTGRAVEPGWDA